jgi:hypothetical protein
MDAPGGTEGTDIEEPAPAAKSEDVFGLESVREDKNFEEVPTLPSHAGEVPLTVPEKPTFMRIERKHISSEILARHSIPHIDDPVRKSRRFGNSPLTESPGPGFHTHHAMASRKTTRGALDRDFDSGRR